MTTDEKNRILDELKRAYYEGYNDSVYRMTEYARELGWRQSTAHMDHRDLSKKLFDPGFDK